jgi:hypothetical protein
VMSQDKAARLRCPRVNGFFLEDDQSGRFFFGACHYPALYGKALT